MVIKEKNYILVDHEDLVIAMDNAKRENHPFLNKLMDLFLDINSVTTDNKIIVKDKLATYILNMNNICIKEDLVSLESLSRCLSIAIYECNHEMKRTIQKYFRNLMDAEINHQDTSVIINIIMSDEKVMEYITKYEKFDDYIKLTIKKRLDKDKKEQNKSYVIM